MPRVVGIESEIDDIMQYEDDIDDSITYDDDTVIVEDEDKLLRDGILKSASAQTLIAYRERIKQHEKMVVLLQALHEAHREIEPIYKEQTARTWNYANLAQYMSALRPILVKQGLVIHSSVTNSTEKSVEITTYLHHISGGHISTSGVYPIDTKNKSTDIQGYGSTISYGIRYNLIQLFALPAEDTDGEVSKSTLIKTMRELMKEANVKEVQILERAKVSSVDKMSEKQIQSIIASLHATIKKSKQNENTNGERSV